MSCSVDLQYVSRPGAAPDFHHNFNTGIAILAKLQTGLDVNVKFTGVKDFKYTTKCIIFDLLGITLYHGWLVDPLDIHVAEALASLSYNQVAEAIITGRTSEDKEKVAWLLLCEQWLEDSASQLTHHGLSKLNIVMKEGETAVFFQNNHFNTCYKAGNTVYLLVMDQGFFHLPVVWEPSDVYKLSEGDKRRILEILPQLSSKKKWYLSQKSWVFLSKWQLLSVTLLIIMKSVRKESQLEPAFSMISKYNKS